MTASSFERIASLLSESSTFGFDGQTAVSDHVNELVTLFSSLVDEQDLNMLTFLSQIGVGYSARQAELRERVLTAPVMEALHSVDAMLGNTNHKVQNLDVLTTADVKLLCALLPVFNVVLTSKQRCEYLNTMTWIESCFKEPAFAEVLGPEASHHFGKTRVGGQIDLREQASRVRAKADFTRSLNEGHTKKKSQRQLEKEGASTANNDDAPAEAPLQFTLGESIPQTLSKDEKVAAVVERLNALGIKHQVVHHEAAKDMEALMGVIGDQPGFKCKNLFLKAKKPRNPEDSKLWLVSCPNEAKVNLKKLQSELGYPSKGEIRFGRAEDLLENLGCVQGDVTALSLINDSKCNVNLLLDAKMMATTEDNLWFHPLTNEASVAISAPDLLKFVAASGRKAAIYDFEAEKLVTNNIAAAPPAPAAKKADKNSAKRTTPPQDVPKLSHEEAQARLWARLTEMGCAPHPEDKDKIDVDAKRPVGHGTHNLFLKDKKSKKMFLVCVAQDKHVDMKALNKLIGVKELRMCSDRENSLCSAKGCITVLSLYNNLAGTVTPVLDASLVKDPSRSLVICAGCENPLDHTQHNVTEITVKQMLELLRENDQLPEIIEIEV